MRVPRKVILLLNVVKLWVCLEGVVNDQLETGLHFLVSDLLISTLNEMVQGVVLFDVCR